MLIVLIHIDLWISASVGVQITISDVNDMPPTFSQNVYTFTVSEDKNLSSSVGSVSVTDPDDPQGQILNKVICIAEQQIINVFIMSRHECVWDII